MKTSIKKYRFYFLFIIFIFTQYYTTAQGKFILPEGIEKGKVSFKLINNLVVIPVEVNGTELSFLLDTGVGSTIMFNFSEADSLEIKNATAIKIRGIGSGDDITGLKSRNNVIKIGKATDVNHTILVIFGDSLDLSTRMGVPIHGIIGYEFFKNFIVKTNYNSNKIHFYNSGSTQLKINDKYEEFDLFIQDFKPYINMNVISFNTFEEKTLLIDSGSSDAIWLFDGQVFKTHPEKKYFDDFLGQGLSGVIFGKRAKLSKVSFGNFELENVKVAFPDQEFLERTKFYKERDGSIGGEMLMRFTVIFDYPSNKIYLKKNNKFKKPFHYNMSGISIKHDGVILIKEKEGTPLNNLEEDGAIKIRLNTVYNFYLAPKFVISEIRKDSPADLAGFMVGDEIKTINGRAVHKYKLSEIIGLFASKADKKVSLEVSRTGIVFTKKFYLKKVL